MINKVMRYIKSDETFYVVEYANGKCRRFYHLTNAIVKFTSGIASTQQSYNNGKLIITTWE